MELVNAYVTTAGAQAQSYLQTGYKSDLLQLDVGSQLSLRIETSDPFEPEAPSTDPTEEQGEEQVNELNSYLLRPVQYDRKSA